LLAVFHRGQEGKKGEGEVKKHLLSHTHNLSLSVLFGTISKWKKAGKKETSDSRGPKEGESLRRKELAREMKKKVATKKKIKKERETKGWK